MAYCEICGKTYKPSQIPKACLREGGMSKSKRKLVKMPEVIEIQVGGVETCESLKEACVAYLRLLEQPCPQKIHFYIQLGDQLTGAITFRQEGKKVYVYGDFSNLPDALGYSRFCKGEK